MIDVVMVYQFEEIKLYEILKQQITNNADIKINISESNYVNFSCTTNALYNLCLNIYEVYNNNIGVSTKDFIHTLVFNRDGSSQFFKLKKRKNKTVQRLQFEHLKLNQNNLLLLSNLHY